MKTLFRLIIFTIVIGSFAATSAHAVLLLYYNFDDGAVAVTDSSGGAHHGTILGGPTYSPPGGGYNNTPGRSMDFNGFGDQIRVDDGFTAFDSLLTTGTVTIAFWIFGDVLNPRSGFPVTNFSAFNGANGRLLMGHVPWEDGVVYFDAGDAGGGAVPGVNRIFQGATPDQFEGGWDHWIFIKEPGNSSIYVNDTPFLTGPTSATFTDIESFFVGGNGLNTREGYLGLMDEFAVWDHALDAAERTQVFNGVIPEPSSAALLAVACGAFLARRRRYVIVAQASSPVFGRRLAEQSVSRHRGDPAPPASLGTGKRASRKGAKPQRGVAATTSRQRRAEIASRKDAKAQRKSNSSDRES